MLPLKLSIWFDQEKTSDKEFAQGFSDDLKKCLLRYLPGYAVELLMNEKGGIRNFLVLSVGSKLIADNLADGSDNLHPLHIEPADQNIISIGHPILFWDKQYETGEVRFFRRDNAHTKVGYWEKITDIAIDIHDELITPKSKSAKPKVYLSQDDISHNVDRENIKRDLNDLGYEVVPAKPFSLDYSQCSRDIEEALHGASLIIHIIPPIYNIHFTDSHLSLTEHQCNLSAKMVAKGSNDVIRIIWIPSAYEVTDEENQIFIEKIQRDQDQTRNTFVLKSSIEDLKKYYRLLMAGVDTKDAEIAGADVYLVADDKDVESTLKQNLNNLKVSTPSDIKGITFSQHLCQLARAKSVVISYSSPNSQWLSVKANDILKSKGIDSAKHFESIVLFKAAHDLETNRYEDVFSHVITNAEELAQVVNQSFNNKNS